MNIFIFGARRTGKTKTMLNWLKIFGLPIVYDGKYSQMFSLQESGLKIYREHCGLGKYVRIFENIDHRREELIFDGQQHTIVTATPDTNKELPVTRASIFYDNAVRKRWAIQNLGSLEDNSFHTKESVAELVKLIGETAAQGQLFGKWYDPRESELEELRKYKALS